MVRCVPVFSFWAETGPTLWLGQRRMFPKLLLVPTKYPQIQKLPKAGLMIGGDTEVVDLNTRELVVSQVGKDKRTLQ